MSTTEHVHCGVAGHTDPGEEEVSHIEIRPMFLTGDVYIDALAFTRKVAGLDPATPGMDPALAKLARMAQTVLSKSVTGRFTP